MVRANRPWHLITGLSGSLAAALAAGAFAVVTSDIWRLADSLGPLRLSVATVFSIGAMVAWLVIDHELWERPGGRVARDRARLFNTATVLTVALGVGCLYVALLVATLAAEWLLITGELLGQTLRHPVGWPDVCDHRLAGQLDRHRRGRARLRIGERQGGTGRRLRLPAAGTPRPGPHA